MAEIDEVRGASGVGAEGTGQSDTPPDGGAHRSDRGDEGGGGLSAAPDAVSSSPGSDPGMGMGADSEMDVRLRDQGLPDKGVATRAAEEGDTAEAGEGSSEAGSAATTPGYTP